MTDFSFASYARGLQRLGLVREIEARNRRLQLMLKSHLDGQGDDHGLATREDASDPHSVLIVANAPLAMTLGGR